MLHKEIIHQGYDQGGEGKFTLSSKGNSLDGGTKTRCSSTQFKIFSKFLHSRRPSKLATGVVIPDTHSRVTMVTSLLHIADCLSHSMQWSKVEYKRLWGGEARNNIPTEICTIFFIAFVHDPMMIVLVTMAGSAKHVL
jgi:hypothetical protein